MRCDVVMCVTSVLLDSVRRQDRYRRHTVNSDPPCSDLIFTLSNVGCTYLNLLLLSVTLNAHTLVACAPLLSVSGLPVCDRTVTVIPRKCPWRSSCTLHAPWRMPLKGRNFRGYHRQSTQSLMAKLLQMLQYTCRSHASVPSLVLWYLVYASGIQLYQYLPYRLPRYFWQSYTFFILYQWYFFKPTILSIRR